MDLHFGLKTKMTLTVLLLVGVILLAGGFSLLWFFESRLKEIIAGQEFALVSRIAEDIDLHIDQAQKIVVQAAASLPSELLGDPERAQTFLDSHFTHISSIFDNGVFLFSTTGKMIAESPAIPGRRGRDYSYRQYFQATVATGRPQISAPYFSSQAHHHPALNFTAPVQDAGGTLVGVLAGSLDLTGNNMLRRVTSTRVGKSGYLYLYSLDRLMIMHPQPERILKRDVPPGVNRLFDKAIAGFEGSGKTVNSRGLHTLSSFKHLRSVDWILAANYPEQEAFEPIYTARGYFAAGLGCALLLATLIVWLVMRRLSAPLLDLTRHVEALTAKGRYHEPLQVETGDEIAVLAGSFNRLMAEVETRKQSVQEQLAFLQTLIDTIPNPIYYQQTVGQLLGCNRAFEKVFGKSHDQIIGVTIGELLPPKRARFHAQKDFELIHQRPDRSQSFDCNLVDAAGVAHDVIFYKAVFADSAGRPAGVVGTIIDITQRKAAETALAEQREFSENLLQNSAVPCFVIDAGHRVLIWTRACEELTGVAAETVLGSDRHWQAFYPEKRPCLVDLVIDSDLETVVELYDRFENSPFATEGIRAQGWFPDLGGKPRYILFEAAPIRDRSGRLVAAIETIHDLTNLKQAEQVLRESEQSYRSLIDRSPDAIIVHHNEEILLANPLADRLFGIEDPKQRLGLGIMDLLPAASREIVRKRLRLVERRHRGTGYMEIRALRLDGSEMDLEAASSPVIYAGQRAVQTTLRDITERKELQDRTWRQANFDTLTGVPNRLMFFDRLQYALEQAERENRRIALLFLDLDDFKEVNDTLGHAAGDALLQEVARRIGRCLRKTDTLARLGGDEFTVIMTGTNDRAGIKLLVERILQNLYQPFPSPGGDRRVSCSIGIAVYPEDGQTPADLVRHADIAMYRAKENRQTTWQFYGDAQHADKGQKS